MVRLRIRYFRDQVQGYLILSGFGFDDHFWEGPNGVIYIDKFQSHVSPLLLVLQV